MHPTLDPRAFFKHMPKISVWQIIARIKCKGLIRIEGKKTFLPGTWTAWLSMVVPSGNSVLSFHWKSPVGSPEFEHSIQNEIEMLSVGFVGPAKILSIRNLVLAECASTFACSSFQAKKQATKRITARIHAYFRRTIWVPRHRSQSPITKATMPPVISSIQ
jgi:hypothetical protein